MTRRICVVTGSRAEYGLLRWILSDLRDAPDVDLQLVVTGMHLSPEFGSTVGEIEKDGFVIARRVDSLLSSGTFRLEDLWAGAAGIGGAERAESIVADMVRVGLLVESNSEGARRFRFFEDGIAAYLWLQSAAQKLRTEPRPAAAATVALAQSKKLI